MNPESLLTTRLGLHALAEHVLSTARYQATGLIGLRVVPGGFGTPPFERGNREILVIGNEVVVRDSSGERREPITTLRAAGVMVDVIPGAPDVFTPTTTFDIDKPLAVDPMAAQSLLSWFTTVNDALTNTRNGLKNTEPSDIQLWPEHFDVAFSSDRVNFGGSLGDDHEPQPYAYVGPWDRPLPAAAHPFWNQTFGASRTQAQLSDSAVVTQFLLDGHLLAITGKLPSTEGEL